MLDRNEIKHRMHSIDQTRQITRAMHLISATKVKKDTPWVELTRIYFRRVRSTMRDILEKSKGIEHRYMKERPGKRTAFIVVAGDKGLAGGFNHNVLSFALEKIKNSDCRHIIAVGQVTKGFFESKGYTVNKAFLHAGHRPYLRYARRMVELIFQMFDDNEIDEIYIVYTRYHSPVVQFPRMIKLLPITFYDYASYALEYEYSADIIYEPSPQKVFDTLVPEFTIGLLFECMVQSYISEHTARMSAMESATKNADDMLGSLTLQYNMARQFAITQEISEIVSAAELIGGHADANMYE